MAYKSGLSEREQSSVGVNNGPHNAVGAHSVVADVCSQTANISSESRSETTTTFQANYIGCFFVQYVIRSLAEDVFAEFMGPKSRMSKAYPD